MGQNILSPDFGLLLHTGQNRLGKMKVLWSKSLKSGDNIFSLMIHNIAYTYLEQVVSKSGLKSWLLIINKDVSIMWGHEYGTNLDSNVRYFCQEKDYRSLISGEFGLVLKIRYWSLVIDSYCVLIVYLSKSI